MLTSNTDRDWESLAASDSYFHVLTDDKFRKANLTDEGKAAFFASGHDYINYVLARARGQFDPAFVPRKSLDFGCGVGRIVIPLAGLSETVTGVDVSDSMLDEAIRNCESRDIQNVRFVKSDDALAQLTGRYDFIHSIIVFQHIPVKRGMRILTRLLAHAEPGAICVMHFTYAAQISRSLSIESWIKKHLPLGRPVINLLRGKNLSAPSIQMNAYDLNYIVRTLRESGVLSFYAEHTDHGQYLGLLMYFQVPRNA